MARFCRRVGPDWTSREVSGLAECFNRAMTSHAPDQSVPPPDAAVAARLAAERAATVRRLGALQAEFDGITAASVDSNADDEHDPEGPTIAFERSQVHALVHQAQCHLSELDAAESRLAAGSYGECQSCGQRIGAARLSARPVARRCIACASNQR